MINIDISHCLQIMLFAVMTTSIAEFSTYLMIYRKAEYKNLKKDIESAN